MPKYLHLLGSRRLWSASLGMFQEFLKVVVDLPGLILSDMATLPPQTEVTTAGRDYPCIKSPFEIKSLAIGAAYGKGSGCS